MPEISYHVLPRELEHLVEKVAKEATASGSASNTIYVITQALGAAYAAGHRDGYSLTSGQRWVTERLEEERAKKTTPV